MKKTTAILLAAILIFSCVACDFPIPLPVPESGSESEADESTQKPADPIVSDAETYTYTFFDSEKSFKIPKIEYAKTGVEAVNTQIREAIYTDYLANVKVYSDKGESPVYSEMYYEWGFKDHYLTIAEIAVIFMSNQIKLTAFYVDLDTMTLIEDPFRVLDVYGLSKDDFMAQARNSIAAEMYGYLEEFINGTEYGMAVSAESCFRRILGDENVRTAVPFIGKNGALSIRCTLGSLAGSDTYESIIPYDQKLSTDAANYLKNFDFNMPTDYTSLVEDGVIYNINLSEYDYAAKLIIPKIYSPHGREDLMNATLSAEVMKVLDSSINAQNGPGQYVNWNYIWGFSGHYLSVVMWGDIYSTSASDYLVMNFDVFSGQLVDKTALLYYYSIYDMGRYRAQVKGLAGTHFIENMPAVDPDFADAWEEAFQYTIADETADCAMPYISKEGELYLVAQIGSVAGPRYHWNHLRYNDAISDEFYQKAAKG